MISGRRVWRLALVLLATACATDGGVRDDEPPAPKPKAACEAQDAPPLLLLDTGTGTLRALEPMPGRAPVTISQSEFERTMLKLLSELRGPPRPFLSRLRLASAPAVARPSLLCLVQDEQRRCSLSQGASVSRVSLLGGSLQLSEEERVDMALSVAFDSLWPGIAAVVKAAVDPEQLKLAIYTSISAYLVLLMIPEPASKLLVAAITTCLVAYLGLDTFFSLYRGYQVLRTEALRAESLSEVRAAGERYGPVIGEQVGRVLVLIATMALGSTGTDIMRQGPLLPGFSQAMRLLRAETGLGLAEASAVQSAVVSGPSLTLTLAPTAMAMASQGMGGEGGPKPASSGAPTPRPSDKYRIQHIEEWRKPLLTPDGKVLPYPGTRSPPEPIVILGRNRAGMTIMDGKHTFRFDQVGFPEFNVKFECLLDDIYIGLRSRAAHFKAANRKLLQALKEDPGLARELGLARAEVEEIPTLSSAPGAYTWHHHQHVGRMQLIPYEEHLLSAPHTGGMAIWGGGAK